MPLFNPALTSIAKQGETPITGDATLSAGSGVTLTQSGRNIHIAATGSGAGDVVGPAGATDNAIARYDGATGKLVQNSRDTIADDGTLLVSVSGAQPGSDVGSPDVNRNPAIQIAADVGALPTNIGSIRQWISGAGPIGPRYAAFACRGTLAVPIASQSQDVLWRLRAMGRSGNSYESGAAMAFRADTGGTGLNGAPVPSSFELSWSTSSQDEDEGIFLYTINNKASFQLSHNYGDATGVIQLVTNGVIAFRNADDDAYIDIIARSLGIGVVPTYGLHIAPATGLTAAQTVFIQDATASTGQ